MLLVGYLLGLDQAFELMVAQYRMRKSTIPSSPDIEALWAEIAFLMDPIEETGHHNFKRLALEHRGSAIKRLQTDTAAWVRYEPSLKPQQTAGQIEIEKI